MEIQGVNYNLSGFHQEYSLQSTKYWYEYHLQIPAYYSGPIYLQRIQLLLIAVSWTK